MKISPIKREKVEVFSKILHLHFPFYPMGFDHPADGEKMFHHRSLFDDL